MVSFLVLLVPLLPLIIPICHVSLLNLRKSALVADLPFSPTDLSIIDISLIIILFVARSIKHSLGLGLRFPRKPTVTKSRGENNSSSLTVKFQEDEASLHLPELCLKLPLHIRPRDIAQYILAIGRAPSFRSSKNPVQTSLHPDISIITSNPAHLSLFLSAISEPALLLLLARKGCPIRPLGAVNVRNRFELLRPDLCGKAIEQANKLTAVGTASATVNSSPNDKLGVHASFLRQGRRVKRGVEIDVIVMIVLTPMSASQSSSENQGSIEIFRQTFTILSFLPSTTLPSFSYSTTSKAPQQEKPSNARPSSLPRTLEPVSPATLAIPPTLAVYMKVAYSAPSLWAKLCKDYNPIHLSSIAAKIYGFRGKIAHGNHVVAMGIRNLSVDGLLSESATKTNSAVHDGDAKIITWMQVRFIRPVMVPVEVGVRLVEDLESENKSDRERGIKFEVFREDKVLVAVEMGQTTI